MKRFFCVFGAFAAFFFVFYVPFLLMTGHNFSRGATAQRKKVEAEQYERHAKAATQFQNKTRQAQEETMQPCGHFWEKVDPPEGLSEKAHVVMMGQVIDDAGEFDRDVYELRPNGEKVELWAHWGSRRAPLDEKLGEKYSPLSSRCRDGKK